MRHWIVLTAAAGLLGAATARADTAKILIDKDNFIDEGDPTNNYGSDIRLKAVSNNGSSQFTGNAHALIELPAGYFSLKNTAGVQITSLTLSIRVQNDQLDADHNYVELHPLTHGFVEGSGTQTPLAPTQNGANWNTYDGVNVWTNSGGDYDVTNFVYAGAPGAAQGTFFTWDMTTLMSNFTAASELEQYGLLLKVRNELPRAANKFLSMNSSDATAADQRPYLTVTYTPEPGTVTMLAGLSLFLLKRKR